MTAPDPTAGEHHPDCYQSTGVPDGLPAGICDCRVLQMLDAASPPAVAASTGTSEDVEALLCLCHQTVCPVHNEAAGRVGEYDVPSLLDAIGSHLAAREAAARAEERERIAQAIEAQIPPPAMRCCDGLAIAARIAREG